MKRGDSIIHSNRTHVRYTVANGPRRSLHRARAQLPARRCRTEPPAVDESTGIVETDRLGVDGPQIDRATTCSGHHPKATTTSCGLGLTPPPSKRTVRGSLDRCRPAKIRPPRDPSWPAARLPAGAPPGPEAHDATRRRELEPQLRTGPATSGPVGRRIGTRTDDRQPPARTPPRSGPAHCRKRSGSRRGTHRATGATSEKAKARTGATPGPGAEMRRATRWPEPRARPFP
jgi:hypothetical protein